MEPTFLALAEVLAIHVDQIMRFGGMPGLRDRRLLLSALAVPQATFEGRYLHEDLAAMAASYLYHIVQNHPFVDGNERVGAVAAVVFLALNGLEVEANEESFGDLVIAVAEGKADKTVVAAFLREHSRRVSESDVS